MRMMEAKNVRLIRGLSPLLDKVLDENGLSLGKIEMWYLASPYTSNEPGVSADRVDQNRIVSQQLMARFPSVLFFSPVVYSEALLQTDDPRFDGVWEPPVGWYEFLLGFLLLSRKLIVLRLPGWEDSFGVQLEIDVARAYCIPIVYLDFENGKIGLEFEADVFEGKVVTDVEGSSERVCANFRNVVGM